MEPRNRYNVIIEGKDGTHAGRHEVRLAIAVYASSFGDAMDATVAFFTDAGMKISDYEVLSIEREDTHG